MPTSEDKQLLDNNIVSKHTHAANSQIYGQSESTLKVEFEQKRKKNTRQQKQSTRLTY